jgi:DNA repair exonuclease SbcCD ATPase subunit
LTEELVRWAERKKGYKERLEQDHLEACGVIRGVETDIRATEEALSFFTTVGKLTQEKIVSYFEDIVTSLLQIIYGDTYYLKLYYLLRRGRMECDIHLFKADVEVSMKDECGGGIIDVVSFGMRLAVWSLTTPRTAPVFILDEPFKYVSTDKLELVGDALKMLCDKLDLQVIMVSHSDELIGIADKSYRVVQEGTTSRVMEV